MTRHLPLVFAALVLLPRASSAEQRIKLFAAAESSAQPQAAPKPLPIALPRVPTDDLKKNPADFKEHAIPTPAGKLSKTALRPVAMMLAAASGNANVDAAISAANNIFSSAKANSSGDWPGILSSVQQAFQGATVVIPDQGQDFGACTPGTIGFAHMGGTDIYLCADLVYGNDAGNTNAIAQVIVHESSHIAGYKDECDASAIEKTAMQQSGTGLAFRNGYMDQCGL